VRVEKRKENKMGENGKVILDGRLCVKTDLTEMRKFHIDRPNISLIDSIAILRHIVGFIHYLHAGGEWKSGNFLIDDYRVFEKEPTKEPRVCVVWNPLTKQIRFAVIGMSLWQAEIACANAADYLQVLIIDPVLVIENELRDKEEE